MTASVLINCYNQEPYIAECLDSVLAQSQSADEVIAVNDGSTDGSRGIIESYCRKHAAIHLIDQKNGGQLSAIETAVLAAKGDVCFLLDADDTWKTDHIARVMAVYKARDDIDFVYTAYECFDGCADVAREYTSDHDHGMTVLVTLAGVANIGSLTSGISCRAHFLQAGFPVTDEKLRAAYRICADDYVQKATSVAGARKFYLNTPTANYRIHGHNNFAGHKRSRQEKFRNELRAAMALNYLRRHFLLEDLAVLDPSREFLTIPRPGRKERRRCVKAISRLKTRGAPVFLTAAYWRA
ncbi:MAG: glycosyltransferase family 2 protein [Lentisphaeria bacterium]|nr:glycosyltransferase family 2 protein [Lentisphaeria bacterium]